MFVPRYGPRYSREQAKEAVAASRSFSEALRKLGMRPAGGNHATLKKYVQLWEIPTDHFDPNAVRLELLQELRATRARPLSEVLVEGSTYSRGSLKRRLYAEGLKDRRCELCGQDETWRGRAMSLILDHVNGVADDNRLDNLRIVCPNCAATLDTHCGRNLERTCPSCERPFRPNFYAQRFCSIGCHGNSLRGVPRPDLRKVIRKRNGRLRRVERPPYQQLVAEIEATSYCAVGRKYGVSDNAIRKWVRQYKREQLRRAVRAGRMRGRVSICVPAS